MHRRTFIEALRQWFEREQALVWVESWNTLADKVRDWIASKHALVWVEITALPLRLAPGRLYVLGKDASLWAIAMQCPCGCGENLRLNLIPGARSYWQVTRHLDGTVSLYPEIRRQDGCRSHFFVRRSRVYWWDKETVDARSSADTAA
jgi:hypothetical protein